MHVLQVGLPATANWAGSSKIIDLLYFLFLTPLSPSTSDGPGAHGADFAEYLERVFQLPSGAIRQHFVNFVKEVFSGEFQFTHPLNYVQADVSQIATLLKRKTFA